MSRIVRMPATQEQIDAAIDIFNTRKIPTLEEARAKYVPGYVYIIRPANTTGVYKIGESYDPYKRNEDQQKKHDYTIEIITTFPVKDKWQIEQALHLRYHRYRLAGEWFALPDWALEEIKLVIEEMDGKL